MMKSEMKPWIRCGRNKKETRLFLFFRRGSGGKETHSFFCCRLRSGEVSAAALLEMGFSFEEDFSFARGAAESRTDPELLAELYEDVLF